MTAFIWCLIASIIIVALARVQEANEKTNERLKPFEEAMKKKYREELARTLKRK
jgi:hypothetical protein